MQPFQGFLAILPGSLQLLFLSFVAVLGLFTEGLGLLDPINSFRSLGDTKSTRHQGRTSEKKGKDHLEIENGPKH